jgi:hypothetical protein
VSDDEAPTPEELREAEALARSLEGEAGAAPPADVMPVVGLLRQARAPGMQPARTRALADRLRADALPRPRRGRLWLWWLLPPLGAAAIAVLLLFPVGHAPRPLAPPRPSGALLAAQAAAARGDRAALETLEREMRGYRRALLGQLSGGRQ